MLTAYQAETVAYVTEGGEIICREHALRLYGELTVNKVDAGLTSAYDLRPLSRFELDEVVSQDAEEYANQELEYGDSPDEWDALYVRYADAGYPCAIDGEAIQ